MTINSIINKEILTEDTKYRLQNAFNKSLPFRHLIIDDFLDPAFAHSLLQRFPSLENMKTHYTGLNERKAEDNDFVKQDEDFTILHNTLSSPEMIAWLTAITGITPLDTANDRLGYGLHQGGNRSFLDIHIDYNIHPISKLQRKLNFLLFLNPVWEEDWGGFLELWDSKSKKPGQLIAPILNRVVIFECSEISYHGYNRINVPENITRKSYYQYYFTTPGKTVSYHDTIFRPTPENSLAKKIAVPVKEFLKNSVKKTLLSLGLERFLK
ncbi:MAG TPA: 2OG-Fe(II) oxygenase [Puia sp.]|jgi:Rps23 Pro-64 3,4-dihydroxylase Tpa1-like proline 4-hydroxylase|nr:2OG-Fe(II) oxygenase [Puia sp.]